MRVYNAEQLDRFARKHPDAKRALADWLRIVEEANWSSIDDVRDVMPNADGVSIRIRGGDTVVATVFNIRGNRYRLIALINYAVDMVVIREVLTHAEYNKDQWKQRL